MDNKKDPPDPTPTRGYRDVRIQVGTDAAPVGGQNFRLCPLGVQFRSTARVEPYTELRIEVDLPDDRTDDLPVRTLELQGMVVQCDRVGESEYKVAVYFTDLEPEVYDLIRKTSSCLPTLCPDCSLF